MRTTTPLPRIAVRAAVLTLLAAAGLAAFAVQDPVDEELYGLPQPSGEVLSNDGTYRLRFEVEPERIPWGERFAIAVRAERTDGEPLAASLALDARMPEHVHGMNREPRVETTGDGSWRVENLLFHMPGYWEVYFDLTRGAVTERAQFSVEVD